MTIPPTWRGAKIATQAEADSEIPRLLANDAEIRYLEVTAPEHGIDISDAIYDHPAKEGGVVDLVVVTGHPDGVAAIMRQCRDADVHCYGSWAHAMWRAIQ